MVLLNISSKQHWLFQQHQLLRHSMSLYLKMSLEIRVTFLHNQILIEERNTLMIFIKINEISHILQLCLKWLINLICWKQCQLVDFKHILVCLERKTVSNYHPIIIFGTRIIILMSSIII